ncbi:hypothetical protein MNAN1_000724 [Malassezia nana]|uniref:Dynein associated protein domain-containing protein n=1 Tax=Malassezia nana TaxID=180528 RepID=A0AAF0EJZ3_9BASI|nr:hypothetical protein MNAN1_000724 [Malassezia nana]
MVSLVEEMNPLKSAPAASPASSSVQPGLAQGALQRPSLSARKLPPMSPVKTSMPTSQPYTPSKFGKGVSTPVRGSLRPPLSAAKGTTTPSSPSRAPLLSPSERARTSTQIRSSRREGAAKYQLASPNKLPGKAGLHAPKQERSAQPASPTLSKEDVQEESESHTKDSSQEEQHPGLKSLSEVEAECRQYLERVQELENKLAAHVQLSKDYQASSERLRTLETEKQELQKRIDELNDGLEMKTLDFEMAEERIEGLEQELQIARDAADELKLEQEYQAEKVKAAMPADAAVLLEQNERLKEALLRLRDSAQETDTKQRRELASLRADLATKDQLEQDYATTRDQLQRAESVLAELKIQADVAHGAQDMLEKLTERNMALEERVEQMAADIQELEALRTVSDELEATHLETEAQLQQELETREDELAHCANERDTLQMHLASHATTIEQFRALVAELVKDRDTWRAKCNAPPAPAPTAPAPTMADTSSLSLVPRLRAIEHEQTLLRLSITRSYLPPPFQGADESALQSLLLYERIARWCDLLRHSLVEGVDVQEQLVQHTLDDVTLAACHLRRSLTHVYALATQISAVLKSAPPDVYLGHAQDHLHLQHIERQMKECIEALEHGRFDESVCERVCTEAVEALEAISHALPDMDSVYDLAAKEIGSASLTLHDVETLLVCAGILQQKIEHASTSEWASLTSRARIACRRLHRRLASLYANKETIELSQIQSLPELGRQSSALVLQATPLAEAVLHDHTSAVLESLPSLCAAMRTLMEEAENVLAGAMSQEHVVCIDDVPPWDARARAIYADLCEARDAAQARLWKERVDKLESILSEREEAADAATAKVARLQHQLEKSHAQVTESLGWRQEVESLRMQLAHLQEAEVEPTPLAPTVSLDYVNDRDRAVKHLQAENSALKAQTWLEHLVALPALPKYVPASTTLASKAVWKRAKELAAAPRVVELGKACPPSVQYAQRQQERERMAQWVAHWETCCA